MADNVSIVETALIDTLKSSDDLTAVVGDRITPVRGREMVTHLKTRDDIPCIYVQFQNGTPNDDFTDNLVFLLTGWEREEDFSASAVGAYTLLNLMVNALRADPTLGDTLVEDIKFGREEIADYRADEWVRIELPVICENVGIASGETILQPIRVYLGTANSSTTYSGVTDWTDLKAANVEYHLNDDVINHRGTS